MGLDYARWRRTARGTLRTTFSSGSGSIRLVSCAAWPRYSPISISGLLPTFRPESFLGYFQIGSLQHPIHLHMTHTVKTHLHVTNTIILITGPSAAAPSCPSAASGAIASASPTAAAAASLGWGRGIRGRLRSLTRVRWASQSPVGLRCAASLVSPHSVRMLAFLFERATAGLLFERGSSHKQTKKNSTSKRTFERHSAWQAFGARGIQNSLRSPTFSP